MRYSLEDALDKLRGARSALKERGVVHAAVFGSTARGQAGPDSDIDILVELDPDAEIGLFGYARLKLDIDQMFGGRTDVVNRRMLRPLLRDQILGEAVDAF